MQHIQLPYLQETLSLEVAKGNLLGVFEPNDLTTSNKDIITDALKNPVGSPPLDAFLEGAKSVLIIINDATRPTPTPAMLEALLPYLAKHQIADEKLTILIATGAHRGATENEFVQLLGSFAPRLQKRCVSHDSKLKEDLIHLGDTRNGTPIVLNKRIFESERIIVTGSVEPHYFAGFTGGRKAFLPGVASYETITENHKLALSNRAHSLALDGNPVHEDMMDALPHINAPIFSLMTVLDKEQEVAAATSGDLIEGFHAAVEVAKEIFCVDIPQKADVVVSVAKFPMDINLYQSQKAIDNGALATKDGGTLILVSSCREGLGDEEFAKLLSSTDSPEEAIKKIEQGYKLGYHKAAKMAAISQRMQVQGLTALEDATLASLFIEPVHDLQQAVNRALEQAKKSGVAEPKLIILPDGCVTVPKVR
ncbi:MAG: nickel-dependent lactate racemase [Sphaerochaeta sp.]|nr:nickel-dependent lactate racemase [Sphaerochaeta sp.]